MFDLNSRNKKKESIGLPKILVVDPDERSYSKYQSYLGNRYRVIFIPDEYTATEMAIIMDVAAVFVAHFPPKQNGLAMLENIKTCLPSIPVVLIVKQPSADFILSAFRLGVREVVKKPLDANELLGMTEKIIGDVNSTGVSGVDFRACLPLPPDLSEYFPQTTSLNISRETASKCAGINLNRIECDYDMRVHFFGRFRLVINGIEVEKWPSKKGRSLFAYLLYNRDKKIYRDVLMDLFWPKSTPDSARNCLNVTIYGLRRLLNENDLGADQIYYQDEQYAINPRLKLWMDVEKFRTRWRRAQAIERVGGISRALLDYEDAASLYKGDFLEDEIYQNWSFLERENLREMYIVLLERLSLIYSRKGNKEAAIRICEQILRKDSCREKIHRRKMKWHYALGERDKALRQYQKCAHTLKLDLDAGPSSETRSLYLLIKSGNL